MSLRQTCLALLLLAMWAPSASLLVHTVRNSSLQEPPPPRSSCPCLSWADTYKTKGIQCGAFLERNSDSGEEMCTNFYEKIQDPVCMNVAQGPDQGPGMEQWCYVSAQCQPATTKRHGYINEWVSWKLCTPEQDDMTREKTVEELLAWARTNHLMPALLFKMAYPTYQGPPIQGGTTWEMVKPYVDNSANRDQVVLTDFPESMHSALRPYMESAAPVVIDSEDHHPPHGILEGHKVFTTANTTANSSQTQGFNMTPVALLKG